jgi:hypothetical protein
MQTFSKTSQIKEKKMSIHEKALQGIFDDMDDFESKKMFGQKEPDGDEGTSITITISPKGGDIEDSTTSEELPADMCGGGKAMHEGGTVPTPEEEADISNQHGLPDPLYKKGEMGMADGGVVAPEAEESEDLGLPPFLRKKKLSSNR